MFILNLFMNLSNAIFLSQGFHACFLLLTQILGWITILLLDLYYYDDCVCDMRLNFQCT